MLRYCETFYNDIDPNVQIESKPWVAHHTLTVSQKKPHVVKVLCKAIEN